MSNTAMTENELLEIEETYPVGCQVEFLSGVYEGRIGAVYYITETGKLSGNFFDNDEDFLVPADTKVVHPVFGNAATV